MPLSAFCNGFRSIWCAELQSRWRGMNTAFETCNKPFNTPHKYPKYLKKGSDCGPILVGKKLPRHCLSMVKKCAMPGPWMFWITMATRRPRERCGMTNRQTNKKARQVNVENIQKFRNMIVYQYCQYSIYIQFLKSQRQCLVLINMTINGIQQFNVKD